MPISAGFTNVVDPPDVDVPNVPDAPMPPLPGLEDLVGTMRATYTDPTGVVWDLSDTSDRLGWFTTEAIAGWGAATFEVVTDVRPRGGETVRFVRPQPARITWPLHVWGDTHMQFVTRYRTIRRAFLMTAHRAETGVLRVIRPDGSAREIDVLYEEGFKGEPGEGLRYANPVLTLFAPDGAWRDAVATVLTRAQAPPAAFFVGFPTISLAQVLGNTVLHNGGDMTAWPTWRIEGPCTELVATNHTTGQAFTLTTTLTAGQAASITTDRPTVRGPVGQNLAGSLNWPGAYLWGLAPGDNQITFAVAGSGDETKVTLEFFQRYEGA